MDVDVTTELQSRVLEASRTGQPLQIRGGGTKSFYGRNPGAAEVLETGGHRGVLDYEPSELVVTARSGTPLAEVERVLADAGQMLPFEPPHFGPAATIGGAVAAGLAGPGRPWRGAPRDVLLGVQILDGRGRVLRFGGQVMKNVAGYDLSRLMAGAMGTLGVLLEVSIRVLPLPRAERTLVMELEPAASRELLRELRARPVPLSGACYSTDRLYLRLSGHASVLDDFHRERGGEWLDDGETFWRRLRDHAHPFFDAKRPLWRVSLPPDTAPLSLAADWLVDWGGAQHWMRTDASADAVHDAAAGLGGHATLFRKTGEAAETDVFQPLGSSLHAIHLRLKSVFDPDRMLNRGRMYENC
jgi:glycolate oxidase FAD binding subunit